MLGHRVRNQVMIIILCISDIIVIQKQFRLSSNQHPSTSIQRTDPRNTTEEAQHSSHNFIFVADPYLCFILKDRQYSSTSVKCFLISFKTHQTLHTLSEFRHGFSKHLRLRS